MRIRQWIGFLIMLTGLGFLSSPFLVGAWEGHKQQEIVRQFYAQQEQEMQTEPAELPPETTAPVWTDKEIMPGELEIPESIKIDPELSKRTFYEEARHYNVELASGGQDAMTSLDSVENFPLDAEAYGYEHGLIGTIRIPRLEVELGLYLGSSYEHMARGAAIFGLTSVPLGNKNENTSIAGHRGWNGTPMFRDIQKIQEDDPIYITTIWGDLAYRVTKIEIVNRDDNTWCKIQKGKTMITLMTCHPYGQNTHRYIVYAELVSRTKPPEAVILQENADTYNPEPKEVTFVNEDGTREIITVDSAAIVPDGSEYGTVMSNVVIVAEDRMKPVAMIMGVAVLAAGIWLSVQTARDIRKQKGEKTNESE